MRALRKVGHITPSCNSVLEPVTAMMGQSLAGLVSHHFPRTPVGHLSMPDPDGDQFTVPTTVAAAAALADAYMDANRGNGPPACEIGIDPEPEMSAASPA